MRKPLSLQLGGIDEHCCRYEVEHEAGCGDEVGSYADLYHAFNERVDNRHR